MKKNLSFGFRLVATLLLICFFSFRSLAQNSYDSVDIEHIHLQIDLSDLPSQSIQGEATIAIKALKNSVSNLYLDLLALQVDSVLHNSGLLNFSHNDTILDITLNGILALNNRDTIKVFYQGSPVKDPSGFGGFYFSGAYAYNIGVAFESNPHNYGRVWFPCFDNFTEKSTYEIDVITSGVNTAHASGKLQSRESTGIGSDSISRWKITTPIPSYLVSVAVADYQTLHDTFTINGDSIPIELVARAGDTSNLKASFIHLPEAIDIFVNTYGTHRFEKIGYSIVPFTGGAMEHATNIAYPLFAVNGNLQYETLMAHELAHHWFGDNITCSTAEDMWINEGFAKFSEHLFLRRVYGDSTYRYNVINNLVSVLRTAHVSDNGYYAISGVPHEITYGRHSYNKGAVVAHNLKHYLGDSLFSDVIQQVMEEYRYSSLDAVELESAMEDKLGSSLDNFYEPWVYQAGYPHLSIDTLAINGSGTNYSISIRIQQRLKEAPAYFDEMPLPYTLINSISGDTLSRVLLISGEFTSDNFTSTFAPNQVIINWDYKDESKFLNYAATIQSAKITSSGAYNLPNALLSLSVTSVDYPVNIHATHHWMGPDRVEKSGIIQRLSTSRYWTIEGDIPDNFNASARFDYDGRDATGALDKNLTYISKDSIMLAYRKDAFSKWEEYPSYTITSFGGNPVGFITATNIKKGEYILANRAKPLNNPTTSLDTKSSMLLYPNPSTKQVSVFYSNKSADRIEVIDITGKLVLKSEYNELVEIDLEASPKGAYMVRIMDKEKILAQEKLILQ